jgi:hypothetical protein
MNVYTLTDPQGGQHTLSGVVVVTQEQRIDTPQEAETFGAQPGDYVRNAVQIPYSALDGYDDALLARWKIARSVIADPPAPVIRPELPKSTVVARLDAIGKLAPVWAILNAQPILFAQWFAPDWPNVYKDDAGMLQVLAGAGLTADEIAQVVV